MAKDFYSIKDFYQSLQNPKYVPTAHRHFQVYLYPIYYYNNQIVTKNDSGTGLSNNLYNGLEHWRGRKDFSQFQLYGVNDGNGFFSRWFTEETIEQFSLAIQSITFPTVFGTPTLAFQSPFGSYYGIDNNNFYGKLSDNSVTFTLIDQMEPFFEKKINDWIFTIHRCTIPNQKGTLFPKVNMAIKYFKLTEVVLGNTPTPNFIYYFKEAFPVKFDTCKIDHGGDSDADLRRTLVFNFNTMYVLHDRQFAERYKLGYLFDPVTVS